MRSSRAVSAMWSTVAFNLLALWVAIMLVFLADAEPAAWLPVASLALGGVVGLVSVARPQTLSFGAGCLGGTAVSVVVFAVLLVIFFVSYFVLGGHELS